MVNLTTDIFGTSFSSPNSPTGFGTRLFGSPSTLSTFQNLSPQQQAALNALITQLGTSASAPAQYTGQLSAPTNQLQSTSLAAMEQAALSAATPGGPNSYGMGGTAGAAAGALTDVMNQQPQDLTSFFKSTIIDPAMLAYQQQVLPELQRQYRGISGFGSDKMTAEGVAAGNLMTGIASAMGSASEQALQAQQQNKIAAALGLSNVGTADINNMLNLQAGGSAAQQTAQQPLTASYNEFIRQQSQRQQDLQALLQALGINTVTPVVSGGQTGLLGGAAGGSAGGAIGGAIGSFL